MKPGESAEETCRREISEEIGQTVDELRFIRSYPYEKKEMLMLGFLARVRKRAFVLSGEVDAAEWVRLSDAAQKLREGSIAARLVAEVIAENVNFR